MTVKEGGGGGFGMLQPLITYVQWCYQEQEKEGKKSGNKLAGNCH